MIIECTKCQARFLVADNMIPPQGRNVRCGACGHQWFLEPANAVAGNDAPPPASEPAETPEAASADASHTNVPALSAPPFSTRPLRIAAPLLAAAWLGLAAVAYFPHWMEMPVLSDIYAIFGVEPAEGLVFSDIHMDHQENEDRTTYIISGSIVNHAADERQIPTVHVTLKDKDGKALWGRDYPVDTALKPGGVYPFRIDNIQTSFAPDVKSIIMDLGNPLQLMVR